MTNFGFCQDMADIRFFVVAFSVGKSDIGVFCAQTNPHANLSEYTHPKTRFPRDWTIDPVLDHDYLFACYLYICDVVVATCCHPAFPLANPASLRPRALRRWWIFTNCN